MLSISLIKIKFLTILSMVFMGLFSRFVLGFPLQSFSTSSNYQNTSGNHRFPDGGARTSLRFIPAMRIMQKRRRTLANGNTKEDEIFTSENTCENPDLDFIGEVIDHADASQIATFSRT